MDKPREFWIDLFSENNSASEKMVETGGHLHVIDIKHCFNVQMRLDKAIEEKERLQEKLNNIRSHIKETNLENQKLWKDRALAIELLEEMNNYCDFWTGTPAYESKVRQTLATLKGE